MLVPRRYGGLEFDIPTFMRVIVHITHGCPSTGWSLCLPIGHTALVASWYPEEAQTALLSDHFFAASFGAAVRTNVTDLYQHAVAVHGRSDGRRRYEYIARQPRLQAFVERTGLRGDKSEAITMHAQPPDC